MKYIKLLFFLLLLLPSQLFAVELITGEIRFVGNDFFSDQELSLAISLQEGDIFSMQMVNDAAKTISELYKDYGYFHVIISQPEIITTSPQKIDIVFGIDELQRLKVGKLNLLGNSYIQISKIPKFKGKYLNDIPNYLGQIAEFYNENGFLFSKISIKSITKNLDEIDVEIIVDEGRYCEFSKFRIRGNKSSQAESIIAISGLNLLDNISTKDFDRAEEKLLAKLYIKEASIIPLNYQELLIDIKEDRMTLFSGVVGYDESAENRLAGYFNLDFLNLLGTDRALSFYWQRLSAASEIYNLNYHESGFYHIPINADIEFYREQSDSTYIRNAAGIDLFYYNKNNKVGLYFAKENIIPGSREDEAKIFKRDYTKIGFNWIYDSFDNHNNPTEGFKTKLKYFNTQQKSEENINRNGLETSLAFCFQPISQFVLFFDANANFLENRGLASMDYWKLGGYKNLRGFMEDSFYGYNIINLKSEYRFIISRNSRLFLFSDYGFVENDIYTKGKLFGLGGGIRLQTKVGIIGVDYGFGYSEGEFHNPLGGIIHFGIETKF